MIRLVCCSCVCCCVAAQTLSNAPARDAEERSQSLGWEAEGVGALLSAVVAAAVAADAAAVTVGAAGEAAAAAVDAVASHPRSLRTLRCSTA